MTSPGPILLSALLAACSGETADPDAVITATTPVGIGLVEGTPEVVPHEEHAHVNQPPGFGKAVAPPPEADPEGSPSGAVDPYGTEPHKEVPHTTMPAGVGPDGKSQAEPKPPPPEPLPEGEEIPEVPPLVLQEGPTITIRGQAAGVERGQVRFTEKRDGEWIVVEVNVIVDGRFEVVAPANIPYPVHVSVGSDLLADGPTDDDLRGALPDPISIGEEDLSLVIPMGTVPGWAKSQDPPIHQILDREAVLHAAKDR